MPAKPSKKRNRSAQDATLRNVRATAKRLLKLTEAVYEQNKAINRLTYRVKQLEAAAVDAIYLEGRGKKR